jgi:DNA mismatch repair protein MutL
MEVRNLFFNTPARRKFMRGASTEFGHINELAGRIALARPSVAFKLTHNGRVSLDVPAHDDRRRRCAAVLGADLVDGMLDVDSDERGVKIWGLAAEPSLARTTARYQYVYINDRAVRDRNIMHAIKEAYRGLIEPTKQPVVVLFIAIDPTLVDVNVHPAKSGGAFRRCQCVIHGQVLAGLRQRLLGRGPDAGRGAGAVGRRGGGRVLAGIPGRQRRTERIRIHR